MTKITNILGLHAEDTARTEYIIARREEGWTYDAIANSLKDAGFGHNLVKSRVMAIIRNKRPDLLGSRRRA